VSNGDADVQPRPINCYVALGDSFTAGNGLESGRRWADLVAGELARLNPGLEYVNLARDGATSSDVLEQVPAAIGLRPDLISLVCGANDVILELKPDVGAFAQRLELILGRLKEALPGAAILTANYPEGWDLTGVGPRTRARINRGMAELNRAIVAITAEMGVPCLDVASHPVTDDARNLEADGLHPSPQGHLHAADEFCDGLIRNFAIDITGERKERIWN
jgi:lysophospholipase L1-like esterase